MQVEITGEETAVLIRWKKRADNYVLVRMKAEAILYASRGVDVSIIAEMVERSVKTIREWLAGWWDSRMCSVLTGHAGNQNAAKLTRAQKEDLKAVLAQPPSQSGIDAEFWDVPAIRGVVEILFDVEYESDSSYQLLLRFCGLSFKLPDPFDEHRDEQAITRRMVEVKPWSRTCWTPAGRCTRQTRCAWSMRPRPAACGSRKDSAPNCPWTGRRRPSRSSVLSR